MSNVFAEHCEWINLGCTAGSTKEQNSGDEGFRARHWWVLTQFSPRCLRIWSSRFLWLQGKQIACVVSLSLYHVKSHFCTKTQECLTSMQQFPYCCFLQIGKLNQCEARFLESGQSSRNCFTWLISALPSCFSQSITSGTRCWSHAASAHISSQPPSPQRQACSLLPKCCSWLWAPQLASASKLVLSPELNNYIPLGKLPQERHSKWLYLVRCFALSRSKHTLGDLSSYGRVEGIDWGWSISRGSFKSWVLVNGPPNTRWGCLLLYFRNQYPIKWSILWNYSVLFLIVTHKEDAFSLVLIWITIRSLSLYFLPPLSLIKP